MNDITGLPVSPPVPLSAAVLRTRVKQLRRDAREVELAEKIEELTHTLRVRPKTS